MLPFGCPKGTQHKHNVTHIIFSGIVVFPFGFLELIKANVIEAIAQATIWGQSQLCTIFYSSLSQFNFSPGLVNCDLKYLSTQHNFLQFHSF